MEDKKQIRISLGTAICIFIIVILLCALGIVYYLGFVQNKNTENPENTINQSIENNITTNATKNTSVANETINIPAEKKDNGTDMYSEDEIKELTKDTMNNSDYLKIKNVKSSGDKFIITADYCLAEEISELKYKKMVKNGSITINNKGYTFKNDNPQSGKYGSANLRNGYIIPKNKSEYTPPYYTIFESDGKYTFEYEVGGVSNILNHVDKTVTFEADKNMPVRVLFDEKEHKLKDYSSKVIDGKIFLDDTNNLCISVDPR